MSDTLVLMHGFGGGPSVFQDFIKFYRSFSPTTSFLTPDFYNEKTFHPKESLHQWSLDFQNYLAQHINSEEKIWLVGYSMGGRLAMQAVLDLTDKVQGAVFLSAFPGFMVQSEKLARQRWDKDWANTIQSLEWAKINEQWNNLSVFKGSAPFSLRQDVERDTLAENLCQWSPAQHLFSVDHLKQVQCPCLWLCGGRDQKYVLLYGQLRQSGVPGMWKVVPEAGHRLLVSPREGTIEFIYKFIQSRGGQGECRESIHQNKNYRSPDSLSE